MIRRELFTSLAAALFVISAPFAVSAEEAKGTPSPAGAKVFITEPKDGATVSSPVAVKFGIEGMDVAPAGTEKANSGHHHLIVDGTVADMKAAIPADDNHKHFGKGQTEATVELKPGEHTLQLVLGDHNHVPHNPPVVSPVIKITVK
jgi:Domain of unknown function (DUF4399)